MKNRKVLSTVIKSIILLIFHIFYFFCNTFPKHLLEFDSALSIVAILLNLLFYVVYFFFLTICVYQPPKNREVKTSLRFFLGKIAALLVVQIVIDLARIAIGFLIPTVEFLSSDLLTLVGWLSIYFILRTNDEKPKLSSKIVLLIIAAILGVGICLCADIIAMNECAELTQKFSAQHPSCIQPMMNLEFEYGVRNLILDTFLGILFLINVSKASFIKFTTAFSRVFLVAFTLALAAYLKLLIFPYNILIVTPTPEGGGTNYRDTYEFVVRFSTTTAIRMTGYHSQKNCYSKTDHELIYENRENSSVVAKYSLCCRADAYVADSVRFQGSTYDLDSVHVVIKENWAISYAINDKPTVILFPEIKDQPRNDILIEVCKKMIADGNMSAFDYSYAYIDQYDPEFLIPYAERYAEQTFNENEIKYIDDYGYNKEYIASIARTIL